MKAAGVESDSASLDAFFTVIEGKTLPELVAAGSKKHISLPSGGGGGARVAAAGGAAAPAEEKKEEKKEEVEEVDMGGLFGDDEDY